MTSGEHGRSGRCRVPARRTPSIAANSRSITCMNVPISALRVTKLGVFVWTRELPLTLALSPRIGGEG